MGTKTTTTGSSPEPSTNPSITPHEQRAVSVTAGTDPRTVGRYLAGLLVTSTCRARIEEALRVHHLEHLVVGARS